MLTASIKFDSAFLAEVLRRYRQQHMTARTVLICKLVVLVVLIPSVVEMFLIRYSAVGLVLATLGVLFFLIRPVLEWFTARSFKKSPFYDEEIQIEITDDGYHATSPRQDVMLKWSAFTKVDHFRDGFLLYQGPQVCNWLPLSSLHDPSEAKALEELLRAKIPRYRVVG